MASCQNPPTPKDVVEERKVGGGVLEERAREEFACRWGGGGLGAPFPTRPPPLGGAPRAGSLFSIIVMHIANHWFLRSHSKTALPLVGRWSP